MQYRTLGKTGLHVSALSFGASSLGGVFHAIDESTGIRTVHTALDHGINLIDVSPYYGITKAETVLGKALAGIARDRYYLSTKVGRYDGNVFDFSAARVTASVDESLVRLGLDYVDIINCHDIEFVHLDQIVNETLPALRKLQEQGKVRFVGITGLPLKIFTDIADRAPLDVILSYCHYSLNDTTLADVIPAMNRQNIGIINASPLSMGLLSDRGTPEWHPAHGTQIAEVCSEAARFCREHGADIATLAVAYSTANPDIPTTLVSTANPDSIVKNIRAAETPIDQSLLNEVLAILAPIHNQTWPSGLPENN